MHLIFKIILFSLAFLIAAYLVSIKHKIKQKGEIDDENS